jgi:hypothetical protein
MVMKRLRIVLLGALIGLCFIAQLSMGLAQDLERDCPGQGWTCETRGEPDNPNCHRAEFLALRAGCQERVSLEENLCCLYVYALYRCRIGPNPCLSERTCGNSQEVVYRIRSSGECKRITVGTPGYKCTGGGAVLDGGTNSDGVSFITPERCGEPVRIAPKIFIL